MSITRIGAPDSVQNATSSVSHPPAQTSPPMVAADAHDPITRPMVSSVVQFDPEVGRMVLQFRDQQGSVIDQLPRPEEIEQRVDQYRRWLGQGPEPVVTGETSPGEGVANAPAVNRQEAGVRAQSPAAVPVEVTAAPALAAQVAEVASNAPKPSAAPTSTAAPKI